MRSSRHFSFALVSVLAALGCGSNNVSSNDDARRAYLGLDYTAVQK
jgi:hypothetical protein